MKSITHLARQRNLASNQSWVNEVARTLVFKLLANIEHGQLTVEEGDQVYRFGESGTDVTLRAHIVVHHPDVYPMVLFNGTIGSGEAYMSGAWSSPSLLQVIRLMVVNMSMLQKMDSNWSIGKKIFNKILHLFNRNNRVGSKHNIAAHYDLGNDFFRVFLDETMQYSAALYREENDSLYQASLTKIRHIGERLQLKEGDQVLEIGCGWGGLAVHLAKTFNCTITSVTISKEQYEYARNWVARENLQDQVTVRLQDYRDVQGQFDKIISIEMIEAVGHQYYREYFSQCCQLLKPNGLMLLQGITIADQRYELEKNNVDFIQKYIFPGGCLPSLEVITRCIARYTDMQLVGLEDITFHYARTLAAWRDRFFDKLDVIKNLGYSDEFVRMWDFYLNYCEGGFRERVISTSQVLIAKPRCQLLPPLR